MVLRKRLVPFVFALFWGVLPCAHAAQNYDLKEITPTVQNAIQSRQARYSQLQHLKSEGVIGESNQGFVSMLKELPDVSGIIAAENQDREVIYQAVVDQNGLGQGGLGQVKAIFAEVQRGKAQPGELIQLPSGEWVRK
ncbi:MAG: DUF1318 domain-containing protein [Candidatus Omnitrophica bacterium]|nr:DUF1318 domain-containing protein [Candidatus Omnitrophota bacterium]